MQTQIQIMLYNRLYKTYLKCVPVHIILQLASTNARDSDFYVHDYDYETIDSRNPKKDARVYKTAYIYKSNYLYCSYIGLYYIHRVPYMMCT